MRTTIRIDDDLLDRLKARAIAEKVSLTRIVNRVIKAGLAGGDVPRRQRRPYRERVHAMGAPQLALDKALALAAVIEDDEVVRELATRS